jgi:hypothetical protein
MFKLVQGVGIIAKKIVHVVQPSAMVTELSRSIDDNTVIISNRVSYNSNLAYKNTLNQIMLN